MPRYTQEFKVQCVEKSLSRRGDQPQKELATNLGVGLSTLQRWISLAKANKLEEPENSMSTKSILGSKEKSPQAWTKKQRLEGIMHCHNLNDEQISSYCREKGIYPHHLKEWKIQFLSDNQGSGAGSRQDRKKLRQENKRLKKELHRKERALSETAALLVLSKKCQAIWGEKEDE